MYSRSAYFACEKVTPSFTSAVITSNLSETSLQIESSSGLLVHLPTTLVQKTGCGIDSRQLSEPVVRLLKKVPPTKYPSTAITTIRLNVNPKPPGNTSELVRDTLGYRAVVGIGRVLAVALAVDGVRGACGRVLAGHLVDRDDIVAAAHLLGVSGARGFVIRGRVHRLRRDLIPAKALAAGPGVASIMSGGRPANLVVAGMAL